MPAPINSAESSFSTTSLSCRTARATYKQLVKELRMQGESREELDHVLDRLTRKGDLVELRSGHFIATRGQPGVCGRAPEHASGRLWLCRSRPRDRGPAGRCLHPSRVSRQGHARRCGADPDRAHRGRRPRRWRNRQGPQARPCRPVVGEFRIRPKGNFVVPQDDRIQQWIEIPDRHGDAARERQPGPRGRDAGAGAEHGRSGRADRERRRCSSFPKRASGAVGRVIEILGHPGRLRRRRGDHHPQAPHPASFPARGVWSRPNGSRRHQPGGDLPRGAISATSKL